MKEHELGLPGHGVVKIWVGHQRDSLVLRLARLVRPAIRGAFVTWRRRVYAPDDVVRPHLLFNTLAHEYVHVLQQEADGDLRFLARYATREGRWLYEREAFLHEALHCGRSTESCAAALASPLYALGLDRRVIEAWFSERLA